MEQIQKKIGFICDMDGVVYHGNKILPGVTEFINWMIDNDKRFVFLTNSSERTPHELSMKLARMGLQVDADHFYTSAMATAAFLASQKPNCARHQYDSEVSSHSFKLFYWYPPTRSGAGGQYFISII